MFRVNHERQLKSEDGACTNEAESWFSRLRRAEMGIHHRISGKYLYQYANEMAWRGNPFPPSVWRGNPFPPSVYHGIWRKE
jgi:hypothetical protein